jgi:hypothetical protein
MGAGISRADKAKVQHALENDSKLLEQFGNLLDEEEISFPVDLIDLPRHWEEKEDTGKSKTPLFRLYTETSLFRYTPDPSG